MGTFKRYVKVMIAILCVMFCFSACQEWRDYSLNFMPGVFFIKESEKNPNALEKDPIFTPESRIEITYEKPADDRDAFIAELKNEANHTAYFLFYNLSENVESVKYGYTAERSSTFRVERKDGNGSYNFTIYSFDWIDKIYFIGDYDYYFEA